MIKIVKNGMRIQLDENTLAFSFQKEGGREWRWDEHYAPYMECAEGNVFFRDASEISHETFRLGKTGNWYRMSFRPLSGWKMQRGMCAVNGSRFRKKDWT